MENWSLLPGRCKKDWYKGSVDHLLFALNSVCGDICLRPDGSCATRAGYCNLRVSQRLYPPGVDDKVSPFGLFLFWGFLRKKLPRN